MSSTTVGVVWSDFGGVLTPPVAQAAERVAAASGVSWPELAAAAEQVAGRLGLHGLGPLELGILSQREWADQLTACLSTTPHIDLRRWDEYWYADRPVSQVLLDELQRIAGRGVPVGLLTNSVAEWEPHRARMLAGQDVFTATVKSHEIRLAKPDPAIFRYADTVLPAPDGQPALLIDDDPANCAAAEHQGWLTIHHHATPDTIARLRQLRFTTAGTSYWP
ncbi:HAD family hydrolase [Kribbella sp. NPDC050281]|uniref:HAD family hydrolase n=1 Tax=Kribbella sp. NPDC050281 TaxID=3155515 RepID=UPI0033E9DB18